MRLGGEAQARALEYQKTGTMFGMSQQRLAGANRAVAAGQMQIASGLGGLGAGFATGQFGDLFGKNLLTDLSNTTDTTTVDLTKDTSGNPVVENQQTGLIKTINGVDYRFDGINFVPVG